MAFAGWRRGAAAMMPDEVLHLSATIGTCDSSAERFDGLMDTVGSPFPADADPGAARALAREVQAIPAWFMDFRTGP